jgi:response regulator RpfG family c-di-GMP phosphodiesterase
MRQPTCSWDKAVDSAMRVQGLNERILCVDDNENVLASYQRCLRDHFKVDVAINAPSALRLLNTNGPYAVVVSDMHMPSIDGIRLLTQVKKDHPQCVRIMLTGDTDQRIAIGAVNEGSIFRFLTKPCPPDVLMKALDDGVRQYRLQIAERDILDRTLGGCVGVLTDLLALTDPQTFARALHMRERIAVLAKYLDQGDAWEIETAAMLAPIGAATIPPGIMHKSRSGALLTSDEKRMLARVPAIGHKLLASIPRLEGIARIILYQNKQFDGSGFPNDEVAGTSIPVGARLLRVVHDLSHYEAGGVPTAKAISQLVALQGYYDPDILTAASQCLPELLDTHEHAVRQRIVMVQDLRIGHVLRSDIRTKDGMLLLTAGHAISATLLERLRNSASVQEILASITVDEPVTMGS